MRNDYCSNYLEHSAKGKEWSSHKYVAKVKLSSGKWFYFYDTATYQNYLKKTGGQKTADSGRYAKKDPTNGMKVTSSGLSYSSSMSTADKKAKTANYIANGKKAASSISVGHGNMQRLAEAGKQKADEVLSKVKSSSTSLSKKSSGSKSSGSSKKSSGSKSSGSSSKSSGSSKGSGASKSSKAAKTTSAKEAKETTQKEVQKKAFDSAAAIRQTYGVTKEEVNNYTSKEELLESMKKYDDGAFGYITAKNTTYSWEKKNGEIKLIDMNTGEEVSIDEYLNDVKSIQEFRTDNKQKKSKFKK